jgi:hypothetical protein
VTRHIAHFNWATLVADLEDRTGGALRERPCQRSTPLPSAAPVSSGAAGKRRKGRGHRLAALHREPRLIASFSVWETPEHFRDYVYKTVHGAFFRRGHEWFEPDRPRGHVLWWVEAGHIPDIAEARDRVETYDGERPGAGSVRFDWLDAQAA